MEQKRNLGLALIRAIVGIVFLAHGSQKLFVYGIAGVTGVMTHLGIPLPHISAIVVTLAEFIGGLALLAGFFTRYAALILALDMLVAVLAVHLKNGFFNPMGFEFPLTLLVATLGIALAGPGSFSIDAARKRS